MSEYNPPLDLRIYDAIQQGAYAGGLTRNVLDEKQAVAIVNSVMAVLRDYGLDAAERPASHPQQRDERSIQEQMGDYCTCGHLRIDHENEDTRYITHCYSCSCFLFTPVPDFLDEIQAEREVRLIDDDGEPGEEVEPPAEDFDGNLRESDYVVIGIGPAHERVDATAPIDQGGLCPNLPEHVMCPVCLCRDTCGAAEILKDENVSLIRLAGTLYLVEDSDGSILGNLYDPQF